MPQKYTVKHDPIPLMHQLARMAGIPESRAKRMVLVLDVDACPLLFVEQYLVQELQEELTHTPLQVVDSTDDPVVVDVTTMQNKGWTEKLVRDRTKSK